MDEIEDKPEPKPMRKFFPDPIPITPFEEDLVRFFVMKKMRYWFGENRYNREVDFPDPRKNPGKYKKTFRKLRRE